MLAIDDSKSTTNINKNRDFKSCNDIILSAYKDNMRKNLEKLKALRIKMGCKISPETDVVINEFACKMSRVIESKGCPSNMEDPKYLHDLQSKMNKLLEKDKERSTSFQGMIKNLYSYYFTNSCTVTNVGANCNFNKK